MSILKTGTSATLTRTAVSAALALAAIGGLATAGNAATTQQVMTPSSATGSTSGGNTLTLSLASTASPKFTSGFVGVQFQATTSVLAATATCATNPSTTASTATTAAATAVRFLSTTKVSVVVPDLRTSAVSGATGYWLICTYSQPAVGTSPAVIASTATVIGKANYLAAAAPTINSGVTGTTPAAVVPSSGPASGGQVVTINGSGFPTSITATTPLTASFAGVPLTNVTPVSATSFTAVTPPQPASTTKPVLTVTTAGGSVSATLNTTPNTAVYTYVNGITVSPNTVASGVAVDVDVQGTGFTTLDFSTASNTDGTHSATAGAHVFVVPGAYDPATSSSHKTVGESDECTNVAVISDSELICTVDAAHSITYSGATPTYGTTALANGTYTITVVDSGAIAATLNYKTVLSSGATFTVSDF